MTILILWKKLNTEVYETATSSPFSCLIVHVHPLHSIFPTSVETRTRFHLKTLRPTKYFHTNSIPTIPWQLFISESDFVVKRKRQNLRFSPLTEKFRNFIFSYLPWISSRFFSWQREYHYRRIMCFQLFDADIELTRRPRGSSIRLSDVSRYSVHTYRKRHHMLFSKVHHVNDNVDAQIWTDHHSEQRTSRLRCPATQNTSIKEYTTMQSSMIFNLCESFWHSNLELSIITLEQFFFRVRFVQNYFSSFPIVISKLTSLRYTFEFLR